MNSTTEQRYEELLQLARQARLKWVIEAREVVKQQPVIIAKEKKTANKITVSDSLKAKIPAAECVQNILNFLSELRDDGECYDVETIAMEIVDYDEHDFDMFTTNGDVAQNGDAGMTGYNTFINKLIHPTSTEIVKSIQQFVTKFNTSVREARMDYTKRTPVFSTTVVAEGENAAVNALNNHNKLGSNIWTFLDHIFEEMRVAPLWAEESEAAFEHSKTYCEKFLFVKLYPLLFGSDLEDSYNNQKTKERIEALSFLTAMHLDIKLLKNHSVYDDYRQGKIKVNYDTLQNGVSGVGSSGSSSSSGGAFPSGNKSNSSNSSNNNNGLSIDQFLEGLILKKPIDCLKELEFARCPQDKLTCVSRCITSIAEILKECSTKNGKISGTDEFLPVMILTIKYCNPANIHSNLKYVQRYLRPSKLIGKEGYLLTSFVSSVQFIDFVDSKALTIDPEEFERNIARARALAIERNKKQQLLQQAQSTPRSSSCGTNSTGANGSSGDPDDVEVDVLLTEYKKSLNVTKRVQFVSAREIVLRRLQGIANSVEK